MYYAEKIIDGVLHYKTMPNGEWIEMTKKQLSAIILEMEERLKQTYT